MLGVPAGDDRAPECGLEGTVNADNHEDGPARTSVSASIVDPMQWSPHETCRSAPLSSRRGRNESLLGMRPITDWIVAQATSLWPAPWI